MRRFLRILLNGATVLSLLVFGVSAGLWVRSLGHFEQVRMKHVAWPRADEYRAVHVGFAWYSNTLRLEVARDARLAGYFRGAVGGDASVKGFRETNPPGVRWAFDGEDVTAEMNGFPPGFYARHYPDRRDPNWPADRWVVAVRPWAPTVAAGVLPAVWVWGRWRGRRARRDGVCAGCGYDMRATPERCPECGRVAGVEA